MKSKLFNDGTPSKAFAEHLNIVGGLNIDGQTASLISDKLCEWTLATDPKSETSIVEDLTQKVPMTPEQTEALTGIGAFLLREMDESDSADNIMQDLERFGVAESAKLDRLRPLIEALLGKVKGRFAERIRADRTARAGIKTIKGITHLVDLRLVLKGRFEGGSIEDYKPRISTLTPVGILRLRLSGDNECIFQVDRSTLRVLQDELRAMQKELDEATSFVGPEKFALPDDKSVS